MNADRLLQYFERIADAPDVIPRLRQLVYYLAVQGKLATREGDETAEGLVAWIRTERNRVMAYKKTGHDDPIKFFSDKDLPFEIPKHWEWSQLNAIGMLSGGMTPSKNRPDFWKGDVNWFSPKDMKSDELVESELKISEHALKETGLQLYPPGCIFMVARSGILKRTFPVSINRVDAAVNQDLKVLNPFVEGLELYLQIALRGMSGYILSDFVKTGTTVQSLKYSEFQFLALPLPPLPEQHRIVAKVDELMALCDELEAAQTKREKRRDRLVASTLHGMNNGENGEDFQQSARFYFNHLPRLTTRLEHIQKLRQTILNLAVRGRLVPQDPNDEPVLDLLYQIESERELSIRNHQNRRSGIISKMSKLSSRIQIPESWEWVELQDIFLSIADGDHQPPPRAQSGIPFLVIGNIRNRRIELPPDIRFVPEEYFKGLDESRRPGKGKILYTLVGSYGIPVLLIDALRFCVQRHIGILTPSTHINGRFVTILLDSRLVFDQATECATGIAQKTVPLSGLRQIRVPLPPLGEQRRIVAKVDELMSVCDELEGRINESLSTRGKLLEAALYEALKGRT